MFYELTHIDNSAHYIIIDSDYDDDDDDIVKVIVENVFWWYKWWFEEYLDFGMKLKNRAFEKQVVCIVYSDSLLVV